MLKSKSMSRRTAIKSVFFLSVLPGIFITSCTNSLNSPENTSSQNSKLYKSALDSDILALEYYNVKVDSKGVAEVPREYIYEAETSLAHKFILLRIEKEELGLRLAYLGDVKSNSNSVFVTGLDNNMTIIKDPTINLRILKKKNKKELKRKFLLGRK